MDFKDYYATLSAVDDSVGRLLDYLKKYDSERYKTVISKLGIRK